MYYNIFVIIISSWGKNPACTSVDMDRWGSSHFIPLLPPENLSFYAVQWLLDCEECYAIGISWWHDFSQNSISFRGWDNVSFTLITSFFCIGWSLCWNISILMTIMRKWEVYKLKCNCPISRATLMWCDWCQHVLFLDCRKKDLIKKN